VLVYSGADEAFERAHTDLFDPREGREYLDERITETLLAGIEARGYEGRVAVLPDHPTPVETGAHASGPVSVAVMGAGIAAHGFARVHCDSCRHEYLVAFSCKVRDLCPSCGTRRMVEAAAHLVDTVLPRVPYRQWVVSVPKRVRWFLKHRPEALDGLARVFLRATETALRRASRDAPRDSRFGAVLFVHRFGDSLNSHVHFHVIVTDGVFSADLDAATAADMREWRHGGGWSVDASVRVADWDRQALERLVRYCARPPLASGRLGRLNADTLVYRLRRPLVDGRTEILLEPLEFLARLVDLLAPPRKHRHRYCGVLAPAARLRKAVIASAGPAGRVLREIESAREAMGLCSESARRRPASRSWALLLARIHENRPLQCPRCGGAVCLVAM